MVEINDYACEICKTNSQIKFKTTILKSNLCNYSDAYILAKNTLTVADTSAINFNANNTKLKVIFKNFAQMLIV